MRLLLVIVFTCIYYTGLSQDNLVQKGIASYYGKKFHGKKTASGETFDMHKLTAAHRTLPFNTRVKVTNVNNKRSVIVRINDRGPFIAGRIIDVSRAAAEKLGFVSKGRTTVRIEVLGKKSGKNRSGINKAIDNTDHKAEITDPQYKMLNELLPGKSYTSSGTPVRLRGFGICIGENVAGNEAYKLIKKVSVLGNYRIYLYLKESSGEKLYTVSLGNFEAPEAASRLSNELKTKGYNGFIRQH